MPNWLVLLPIEDADHAAATSWLDKVRVRRMNRHDLPSCIALHSACAPFNTLPVSFFVNCMVQSKCICLVAVRPSIFPALQEEVLGCLTAQERSTSSTYITSVCVSESFRRRGVGRLLCSSLPKRNCALTLHCASANVAARGLYRQLGFVEERELKDYYRSSRSGYRDALLCAKAGS